MEQKTHRNVNDMFGNVRHRGLLATSPNGQKSLLQKKNAVCVRECLAAVQWFVSSVMCDCALYVFVSVCVFCWPREPSADDDDIPFFFFNESKPSRTRRKAAQIAPLPWCVCFSVSVFDAAFVRRCVVCVCNNTQCWSACCSTMSCSSTIVRSFYPLVLYSVCVIGDCVLCALVFACILPILWLHIQFQYCTHSLYILYIENQNSLKSFFLQFNHRWSFRSFAHSTLCVQRVCARVLMCFIVCL